jgi:hypothetical protein
MYIPIIINIVIYNYNNTHNTQTQNGSYRW